MLRTIGFFVLIGCAAIAAILILEFLNLHRQMGDLLEGLFGPLANENDLSIAALAGMSVGWAALGLASLVPQWKQSARRTIFAWPLSRRPFTSYLIRVTVFPLTVALALMLSGGLFGVGPVLIVVASAAALCGMMLFDFRAVVLPGADERAMAGEAAADMPPNGWVLPETVTLDMLGQPAVRFELARDLRNRAVQTRRFSMVALAGIGALLVVAVNVILFAGFIANLGVGASGPERIQAMLDAESAAIRQLSDQRVSVLRQQNEAAVKFIRDQRPSTRAPIKDMDDLKPTDLELAAFRATSASKQFADRLAEIDGDIEHYKGAVKAIQNERVEYLRRDIKANFGTSQQTDNVNLLISSVITRFDILFIMIFIVQILVNLYRYTMRLSAYYLSQADALLLASDGEDALLKLVPALSPTQVDFGKAPDTPAQNLEKLLEMAAKLRSVS